MSSPAPSDPRPRILPHDSSPFLQACRGEIPATRPIWLMRQAGRILQPYRELKEKAGSIETLFSTPELAAEVTLMPVHMLGVDAAILFADIFTPVIPMGCQVEFTPAPRLAGPVRLASEVDKLRVIESVSDLPHVLEAIRIICSELPETVPLIGFAGAPFTLASYLAEGGGAREFTQFRRMIQADPKTAHSLMRKLTETTEDYLRAQIRAGASVVQLFDTCVGALSAPVFSTFVLPYLQEIFKRLESENVPRIYYANGASHLTAEMGDIGADVLSLDWRTDLAAVFTEHGGKFALQGNLDPCALFGSEAQIEDEALTLLRNTARMPHIFNIGHGVHPETPSDSVKHLVDVVHEFSSST